MEDQPSRFDRGGESFTPARPKPVRRPRLAASVGEDVKPSLVDGGKNLRQLAMQWDY
jgi:hypothetical protein